MHETEKNFQYEKVAKKISRSDNRKRHANAASPKNFNPAASYSVPAQPTKTTTFPIDGIMTKRANGSQHFSSNMVTTKWSFFLKKVQKLNKIQMVM